MKERAVIPAKLVLTKLVPAKAGRGERESRAFERGWVTGNHTIFSLK
jgi:hypothetical protein